MQLRREGAGTALIDPIAVPDLSPVQEATSGVEWILHAATQDLGCLAEVGLRPDALFDTELAGRLLGRERVSLAALVGSELGFELQKGHGATDWSVRPLSSAQLRYAALDVEVLVELRNVMESELAAADKLDIAHQEFTSLLSFAPRDRGDDAWRRTSGIHRIRKPRDLAAVRALWMERDEIGRSRDVAIGRILPDASIVAAVQAHPGTVEDLASLREFHGRGAHRYLGRWWRALQAAASLPADQLPESAAAPSGPPQPRVWAERDPAAFARLEAARAGLSALSEQLTMPVENLLQPELVRRVCWEPPADVADLVATLERGSARGWQIERTLPVFEAALWPADPLGVTGE